MALLLPLLLLPPRQPLLPRPLEPKLPPLLGPKLHLLLEPKLHHRRSKADDSTQELSSRVDLIFNGGHYLSLV